MILKLYLNFNMYRSSGFKLIKLTSVKLRLVHSYFRTYIFLTEHTYPDDACIYVFI